MRERMSTTATDSASVPAAGAASSASGDAKQKKTRKPAAGKATGKKTTASPDHPKYSEMVQLALASLKERGGSSRQAVLKYIMKNFNVGADENQVNTHLKLALKA